MAAVWMRARAELRRRWRAWLALALLTGIFGGAVIALAAGARRTESAYARFMSATNAAHVHVPNLPFGQVFAQFDLTEVARDPAVAESARVRFAFGAAGDEEVGVAVPTDPHLFRSFNAARVISGRFPQPTAALEISVPFSLAESLDLQIGGPATWMMESFEAPFEVTFEVVGIHATVGDFPPVGTNLNAIATPAFMEAYGDRLASFEALAVRLHDGAAIRGFHQRLDGMGGGKIVFTVDLIDQAEDVERAISLQALALWLVALIAGATVALVLGQAIARQSLMAADEDPAVRALGMSGKGLLGVAAVRGALVGLVAASGAVVLAFALSPLTPRGTARVAEPDPGPAFDAVAIGIGGSAIAVLVVAVSVVAGVRRLRRPVLVESRRAPSLIARALVAIRARPASLVGVRFGLEPGRGNSAVPVRTTIAGVALGMATLIGTLIFAGNLDRLLETPRLYGIVWDDTYSIQQGFDEIPDARTVAERMAGRDELAAVAVGSQGIPLTIGGLNVSGLALDQIEGVLGPPLRVGRLPSGAGEVVLGAATSARLGAEVGDEVELGLQGLPPVIVTVVGIGTLPPLGTQARFGEGAFAEYASIEDIASRNPRLAGLIPPPDEVFVTYAEGVDHAAAERDIRRAFAGVLAEEFPGIEAADIVTFGRVRSMPFVLAGMLAALAIATLVHALVSSARRRRRELAVLRTLGFVRRQVHAAVRWQSGALAIVTFAIALPAGIAAGRWGWLVFAESAGIVEEVVVPQNVLFVGPASVVLALLVSLLPARAAARTKPALILRSE